ncbi:Spy/CpxP family protein refolding chaperone [Algiphilus sp.]|uniref:Spy/CpxP family protein refolding chaperone n=1 Tax=Algiphilus sp. TaxID=1872431 RepID=UPI0025C11DC6|nr:Spy/CpxP family protein refolding chaperone [Algiphilus sp.]MCK5771130.1 Spy/CpxP family protein refolding chaperone [Algiphilus sp.]
MPRIFSTTLLIAGLMAGGSVLAEGEGKHETHFQKWAEKLELSDDQRAELKQLHGEHMPQMRAHHQKMRELRAAERALDPTAKDFIKRSRKLAEERARFQVKAATTRAEHRQQMANILTAEQRQKMAEAHKQHRQEMKDQHRGDAKGHGRGGGGHMKGKHGKGHD